MICLNQFPCIVNGAGQRWTEGRTMGQHKRNPTAIAAARGELPPKPPRKSKRQCEVEMRRAVLAAMGKYVLETAGGNRYV